uniref:Uncharacterized protein n=1 Tax=Opuntia streptacantha TaxID=393608 RepID=A0A7C8ZTN8_OPUST
MCSMEVEGVYTQYIQSSRFSRHLGRSTITCTVTCILLSGSTSVTQNLRGLALEDLSVMREYLLMRILRRLLYDIMLLTKLTNLVLFSLIRAFSLLKHLYWRWSYGD